MATKVRRRRKSTGVRRRVRRRKATSGVKRRRRSTGTKRRKRASGIKRRRKSTAGVKRRRISGRRRRRSTGTRIPAVTLNNGLGFGLGAVLGPLGLLGYAGKGSFAQSMGWGGVLGTGLYVLAGLTVASMWQS